MKFAAALFVCVYRIFLFIVFAAGVSAAADPVRIQLKWHHQSQFAGFYVAKEKSLYQNEGLEVHFIEGGPGIDLLNAILKGDADFTVCAPEDIIKARSMGEPVRAISSIYRKSAVVFLSQKGSGIKTPLDFGGKIIAVKNQHAPPDFVFQFNALMKNLAVDTSKMTLVPYDTVYTGFKGGSVDITPAYFTGGLVKLKAQGLKMNIIYPGDYRVRFYSDTLASRDETIRERPDVVKRFVRASLQGWRFAIENIDETTDIVMKYARIKDRALQKQMLEASIPLVYTGEDPIGWMQPDEWEHMYRILMAQDLLPSPIENRSLLFTTAFLPGHFSGGSK